MLPELFDMLLELLDKLLELLDIVPELFDMLQEFSYIVLGFSNSDNISFASYKSLNILDAAPDAGTNLYKSPL